MSALEGQLTEERRRVQAAEKKLKMVDVPLSETKDDTRLKQHEKEILVQEVSGFYASLLNESCVSFTIARSLANEIKLVLLRLNARLVYSLSLIHI